ncbi:ATP-binding protein [Salinispira pacifica]
MKQLVVLSGKGGTGKTSVTAALAHLASRAPLSGRIVLADTDVDAANLELVLEPEILDREEFRGDRVAAIDRNACTSCGRCVEVCRFDAIIESEGGYSVDEVACEGCAACVHQCPAGAIALEERTSGEFFRSVSAYGPLYHAELLPGRENSGKLVTLVKQHARLRVLDENRALLVADGPPGTGCPVISAVSGADFALIVTEPTVAGIHDMERALATTEHFGVRSLLCINKADIYRKGAARIEAYCRERSVPLVGSIPYDDAVPVSMVAGSAVTAFRPESNAARAIIAMWDRIVELVGVAT